MSRAAQPALHAYDLLCFGGLAAVGADVVLNAAFLQRGAIYLSEALVLRLMPPQALT